MATLAGGFGLLALALAGVGIYGLLAMGSHGGRRRSAFTWLSAPGAGKSSRWC